VRISKVRTRGRGVTLSGTVDPGFAGEVVVRLAMSGRATALKRTARARNGRWSARLVLPARPAEPRRATATTRATARHAASVTHLRLG
jgi:hypothetical protein